MTKPEAVKLLANTLGQLRLTVAEHAKLQMALETLSAEPKVAKVPDLKKVPDPKSK